MEPRDSNLARNPRVEEVTGRQRKTGRGSRRGCVSADGILIKGLLKSELSVRNAWKIEVAAGSDLQAACQLMQAREGQIVGDAHRGQVTYPAKTHKERYIGNAENRSTELSRCRNGGRPLSSFTTADLSCAFRRHRLSWAR